MKIKIRLAPMELDTHQIKSTMSGLIFKEYAEELTDLVVIIARAGRVSFLRF